MPRASRARAAGDRRGAARDRIPRMKIAGIIGGIGPESTIEYYRWIIASFRERKRDGSYPCLVVNSIDLKPLVELMSANRLAEVEEYLLPELERLARAGADFAALAAKDRKSVV